MKPARGSRGAATGAANPGRKKQPGKPRGRPLNEHQVPRRPGAGDREESGSPAPSRRRLAKGRENLKPVSRASIALVENIMDLSILATLALGRLEKNKSQEHLNRLKHRFLKHCLELKVPARGQQKVNRSAPHLLDEETKKLDAGKETLSALQEDQKAVVEALEEAEEQTTSLQNACRVLREKIEEEEEKSREILQIGEAAVLNLPPVPPQSPGPTLEERLSEALPDTDPDMAARRLGGLLRESGVLGDARVLLAEANKHLDGLLG